MTTNSSKIKSRNNEYQEFINTCSFFFYQKSITVKIIKIESESPAHGDIINRIIYLNEDRLSQYSKEEIKGILTHEFHHFRRTDNYHPFFYILSSNFIFVTTISFIIGWNNSTLMEGLLITIMLISLSVIIKMSRKKASLNRDTEFFCDSESLKVIEPQIYINLLRKSKKELPLKEKLLQIIFGNYHPSIEARIKNIG
jgi:beta-lactamase regulating signal transducer with metallopeptidase domain